MPNDDFRIRACIEEDVSIAHRLIVEHATYEQNPNAVKLSTSDLLRDGFESAHPLYIAALAEKRVITHGNADWDPVGIAVWCYGYNSWNGKMLSIEDRKCFPS